MPADKHDERHNMIKNSKEENSPPPKLAAAGGSSSSSAAAATPWLRLKDPRIVRVSRAFGGKDRHSKVCTIRGLRDRRVRLSVSTAIQLYDLQDRLGLNQPSKVVDWLLNAAKDEIDELPPLPIPSASLGLHYQSMLPPTVHPHRSEFKILEKAEVEDETDKQKQHKSNNNSNNNPSHPSSFSALLNNVSAPPFGFYWDHNPPSSSSTTTTNNLPFLTTSQAEDNNNLHNFNNHLNLSLPSPLSLEFNHLHQNFFINNNSLNNNNNTSPNFHPNVRPFHFSMATKFLSQAKNNNSDPASKDHGFASHQ